MLVRDVLWNGVHVNSSPVAGIWAEMLRKIREATEKAILLYMINPSFDGLAWNMGQYLITGSQFSCS